MALNIPVPRIVPDVGPGGPIVTAMRGMNALSGDMLNNEIRRVQAQYAPLTTQAEAASKLTYANLMGPQFLAKLLGNPDVLANIKNPQEAVNYLSNVASAPTGANALPQQFQGGNVAGNPFAMSFSGVGVNPQLNRTMAGIANVESSRSQNPYSAIGRDIGNGDRGLGKYQVMTSNVPSWTKEAFGFSMTPEQFLNSPEAQEKLAGYMMNKHLNAGFDPQNVASIWFTGKPYNQTGNVQDVNGTTKNQYVNKVNEGMSQYDQSNPNSNTQFFENSAKAAGIKKEGEKAGEIRAQDMDDLAKQYESALQKKVTLNELNNVMLSPEMAQIRQLPFGQQQELGWYKKFGTPQQQQIIGQFMATAGNIVKDAAQDFKGQFRRGEQQLIENMKVNDGDRVDVALGKLQSLNYFNEMAAQRSKIANDLMHQYHLNRLDALDAADKQINGNQIRNQIHDTLNPTVTIRNRKTGQVMTIPVQEARTKYGIQP